MKFGKNLWLGDAPLDKAVLFAGEQGFDYVEISLDKTWPDGLESEENKIKKAAKETGIELAFHAPWAGIHLAHPRNEVRTAGIKVIEKSIRFASRMNGIYLNIHVSAETEGWCLEETKKEVEKNALNSIQHLAAISQNYGINLTIENSPKPKSLSTPSEIAKLLEIHGTRACLDIGHATIIDWIHKNKKKRESKENERTELSHWLNAFKKEIQVIHFHDCIIKEKEEPMDHVMLGNGCLDLNRIIKEIKETKAEYLLLELMFFNEEQKINEENKQKALQEAKKMWENT